MAIHRRLAQLLNRLVILEVPDVVSLDSQCVVPAVHTPTVDHCGKQSLPLKLWGDPDNSLLAVHPKSKRNNFWPTGHCGTGLSLGMLHPTLILVS